MTWAIHIQIAPTWFDPAETPGIITPFMFMYAMHDALLKPMPDNPMAPSLATTLAGEPDGLTYDFELRQGVKFHNGDPFTAEDVKFSFERYKGTSAGDLKQKVKAVEIVNPAPRPLPVARALAGFYDLLRHASRRGGLDCSKELYGEDWQREI